jgi:tetratricopeptide (TPR) repeat protein
VKEWRSYCVDASEPGSPAAVATAARAYVGWLHFGSHYAEVDRWLSEVKRADSRLLTPTVWTVWASALERLHRPSEAIATLDEGLRMHPNFAELLCERAQQLFRAGRAEEARPSAQRAVALVPRLSGLLRDVLASGSDAKSDPLRGSAVTGVAAWGSGEVEGWIGGVLSDGGPLQALCQSIVSVNDILTVPNSSQWTQRNGRISV